MNKQTLMRKIRQAEIKIFTENYKEAQLRLRQAKKTRGHNRRWRLDSAEMYLDRAYSAQLAVPYRPRLGVFKTHRLYFNPETMHGTSYEWYDIVKEINGQVYLNTYRYSQQTSQHISMLRGLFRQLGIKYKCIEAPQGLQRLGHALEHTMYRLAEIEVKNKYARGEGWSFGHYKTLLRTLKALGVTPAPGRYKAILENVEELRRMRLARQAQKRAERKAMALIEVIPDPENQRSGEAGLHVVYPYGMGSYSEERERREALRNGFTKIFVHTTEPRHLTVVNQDAV